MYLVILESNKIYVHVQVDSFFVLFVWYSIFLYGTVSVLN
jgi:hypothetical protein